MQISSDDAQSLVQKLNDLDLTDEEREVLGHLLIHSDEDTQGFAYPEYLKGLRPVQGFNIGKGLDEAFNIGMPPTKEFNIGMPPT